MPTKPEIKLGPKSGKIQRVPTPKPQPDEYTPQRKRRIPDSTMPAVRPRRKEDNSA